MILELTCHDEESVSLKETDQVLEETRKTACSMEALKEIVTENPKVAFLFAQEHAQTDSSRKRAGSNFITL